MQDGKSQQAWSGARLKRLCKLYDISQRDLAAMCGISKSTLSLYIRDKRAPSLENLAAIAGALDVPVSFLLGEGDGQLELARAISTVLLNAERLTGIQRTALVMRLVRAHAVADKDLPSLGLNQ